MKDIKKDINPDFEYFESIFPELLREHCGQFVIIKDKAIQGYFTSIEEALKVGYEKFGKDADFLIQEITNERRANYIYTENK